jgi:hypothetical protein
MRAVVLCEAGQVLKSMRAGSSETVRMIMRLGECLERITVRNKRVNGTEMMSRGINNLYVRESQKYLVLPRPKRLILECMQCIKCGSLTAKNAILLLCHSVEFFFEKIKRHFFNKTPQ